MVLGSRNVTWMCLSVLTSTSAQQEQTGRSKQLVLRSLYLRYVINVFYHGLDLVWCLGPNVIGPACSLRLFKGLIRSDPFVPTSGYSTFGTDCKQNFQFTLLQEKSNPCTPRLLCKPNQCMVIWIHCKPTLLVPVIW